MDCVTATLAARAPDPRGVRRPLLNAARDMEFEARHLLTARMRGGLAKPLDNSGSCFCHVLLPRQYRAMSVVKFSKAGNFRLAEITAITFAEQSDR